jgi:hypothetical protein
MSERAAAAAGAGAPAAGDERSLGNTFSTSGPRAAASRRRRFAPLCAPDVPTDAAPAIATSPRTPRMQPSRRLDGRRYGAIGSRRRRCGAIGSTTDAATVLSARDDAAAARSAHHDAARWPRLDGVAGGAA